MKDFKNRPVIVLFILAAIILAMAISSIVFEGEATPISDGIRVILTPFRAAASSISNLINWHILTCTRSRSSNPKTGAIRIAEMEEAIRESEQALEENERLRNLLKLSERRRDLSFVMAEIVSRDSSNWASTFTIGKGSVHGIEPFDCVVDDVGNFAGYVSEVGTNWAIVTTVIDSDLELGAFIYRTREAAVAEGDFALMSEGLLKLTYLPMIRFCSTGI